MKKAGLKKSLLMLITLTLAVALCACTGDKKNENEDVSSNATSQSEPIYGGSVVVGVQQEFDSLDPHLATSAGTKEVLFNIFEGLVKADADGNVIPAVASNYEISEDFTTYTFTLREGVKFHNGEVVTAQDVKYSLERCAGLLDGTALISALSVIKEVNIVDQSTVEVVLSEPNSELITYLTVAIIPEGYDNQATMPIGTGPFKFVSYTPQEGLVVEKNEDYYVDGVPYLDEVTFKICADSDAAMLELKGGTIDLYSYLTSEQANELSSNFNILENSQNLVQALFLNNAVEPFCNEKVRQAVCYAISNEEIISFVSGDRGNSLGSCMLPGLAKYYEDLSDVYKQDIDKAKELLKEAGYENGFDMTITVPANYQFHMDTAQVIVQQLQAVGINASIEPVEWSSWLSDVYSDRNYQSTVVGLTSQLAPGYLISRFESDAHNNFVNFSDEEFDKVSQEAIGTVDESVKVEKYKRMQEILSEKAASAFIQDPPLLVALNKKLSGYTAYPIYVTDMSTIYFTE